MSANKETQLIDVQQIADRDDVAENQEHDRWATMIDVFSRCTRVLGDLYPGTARFYRFKFFQPTPKNLAVPGYSESASSACPKFFLIIFFAGTVRVSCIPYTFSTYIIFCVE